MAYITFLNMQKTIKKLLDVRTHLLITGDRGSGKTLTTYELLESLHVYAIPFLIVDSYDTKYRNLSNFHIDLGSY